VAYESLGCFGAHGVGYQIRFQSSAALGPRSSLSGGSGGGQRPRLVFITEGLLLRQVCVRAARKQHALEASCFPLWLLLSLFLLIKKNVLCGPLLPALLLV
jgi:hypothetical protein